MTMPELTEDLSAQDKLRMNVISMNTALNDLQHTVEKHHKILIEGNGVPSLVETVRGHTNYIDSTKYWLRFIGGALVINVITFLGAAIAFLVKVYPVLETLSKKP